MIADMAHCLGLLHVEGMVHADFKPLNVVRMPNGVFRLIDLDATVWVDGDAGEKISTAFCPPEMAYCEDDGGVRFKTPGCTVDRCPATPSFDFWSLGCVFYRTLTRNPLFEADDADNIRTRNHRELNRLCSWGAIEVDVAIRDVDASLRDAAQFSGEQRLFACDLLGWLLQREKLARPQSSKELLGHALFRDGGQMKMGPLHVAAALGDVELVRQLLGLSVEDSILSREHLLKKTALHVAVTNLQEVTFQTLLRAAATVHMVENRDLLLPAESSEEEWASARLRFADSVAPEAKRKSSLLNKCVNAIDSQRDTPLHSLLKYAERFDDADLKRSLSIIEILVKLTDPTMTDNRGRTVFDVGCASLIKPVREYFACLRKKQVDERRRALFRETVLAPRDGRVLEPWGLPAGELQVWVRAKLPPNAKRSLTDIVDAMGDIDGLTLLSECAEFTGGNRDDPNPKWDKQNGKFEKKTLQAQLTSMTTPIH
jgi:serine/threonine protein kinase